MLGKSFSKSAAAFLDRKVWRLGELRTVILGYHGTLHCSLRVMARELYSGTSRKLVLAFDIGTEYSGAAYAFLDPGEVPEIGSVTK